MWQHPKEEETNECHAKRASRKQEKKVACATWKDILGENGEEEGAESECGKWESSRSSTVVWPVEGGRLHCCGECATATKSSAEGVEATCCY